MNEASIRDSFSEIEFVFLDRDGVINQKAREGRYVWHWADFHLHAGVESAIAALNRSGRRVIIVTNQRGVALGFYRLEDVDALHARLQKHLETFGAHIDAFYVCPHDINQCNCRKPGTGLLEQAFRDAPNASTRNSLMIGDSLSDLQAARNFGLPSILIQSGSKIRHKSRETAAYLATAVSTTLIKAVREYLI